MTGVIKITRDLADSLGNVSACVFGSVFAWFWLSALLIAVGLFILFAPIETVGNGGRSLSEVVAVIGGFLLVGGAVGWIWHTLSEERRRVVRRLGDLLGRFITPAVMIAAAIWLWSSWQVPDIWGRPLAALTLDDIAQNVLKLIALLWGLAFISAVFRKLIADWRVR
jgi:hypothetical protein